MQNIITYLPDAIVSVSRHCRRNVYCRNVS